MKERSIITGISGFAGGFLAERLLRSEGCVLGFSPDGRWLPTSSRTIQGLAELAAWDFSTSQGNVAGDTGGDAVVRKMIEHFEPEVVYHLAAMSVPAQCGKEEPTERAVAINVEGTRHVVDAILAAAPRSRLVFVSSSHVYAPVDPAKSLSENPVSPAACGRFPGKDPVAGDGANGFRTNESAPVGPTRGYGKTKLAAERLVLDAVERKGLDAVIVRAFQHTGPRQVGRMMLPEWMEQIVTPTSDPIRIHTRDALIDLLDVRDMVCAYELLAERGACGAVYNVGSGKVTRTGDLIDRLIELACVDRKVIETRPGFKQDPVADITRIETDTDWRPIFTIDQTLADTLAWWRENYLQDRCRDETKER